jgi:hypothetical protein
MDGFRKITLSSPLNRSEIEKAWRPTLAIPILEFTNAISTMKWGDGGTFGNRGGAGNSQVMAWDPITN